MQELSTALASIDGVVAVGLGGSRGLCMADENSDYDFVLFRASGEMIAAPLIVDVLNQFTDPANIRVSAGFVTAQVTGKKIELFQKDLSLVAKEIATARNGQFRWTIRQLFPHGDLSTCLISHIVHLKICSEKEDSVSLLRKQAEPFPALLMHALIKRFLAEAAISVMHANKIKKAADMQYLFALCSGFVYYANIVIFAANRMYPVLERGGANLILGLPLRPENYEQRISAIFQAASNWDPALVSAGLSAMMAELETLAGKALEDQPLPRERPLTIPQSLQLAAQQIDAGQLHSAEAILQPLLQQQPGNAEALHLMGVLAHKSGKTGHAVGLIAKAIGIQPDVAQFHSNLGEMYRILKRLDVAIQHGEQAVKLDPNNATAFSNLGIAHYDKKDYKRAEACQHKALELNPSLVQALNNIDSMRRERQG